MRVHQVGKGDGGETDRCDDAAAPGRIGRAAVRLRAHRFDDLRVPRLQVDRAAYRRPRGAEAEQKRKRGARVGGLQARPVERHRRRGQARRAQCRIDLPDPGKGPFSGQRETRTAFFLLDRWKHGCPMLVRADSGSVSLCNNPITSDIWRPLFVIAPQGQRRKADGVTTAPEKESSEPGLVGWIAWVPLTGAFILFGIFLMIWAQIF